MHVHVYCKYIGRKILFCASSYLTRFAMHYFQNKQECSESNLRLFVGYTLDKNYCVLNKN